MSNISKKELQQEMLQALINEAHKNLNPNFNKEAYEYATKTRGLTQNVIDEFSVGIIPFGLKSKSDDLWSIKFLISKYPDLSYGEIEHFLLENGIIMYFDTKSGETKVKEMFGNRLLIPFYDEHDKPIGFASRRIDALEKDSNFESPKYLNSPESEVFHKREMFFNFKNAKSKVKNQDFVVLCEGTFDAIAYFKAGITAVAGSGVALSDKQIEMLKSLPTKNIILSYDNDGVGMDSMFKNYVALSKAGFNISFIDYKDVNAKDMDEIVNSKDYGPETVKQLVHSPITEVEFLIKYFEYKTTHIEKHNAKTNKVEKYTKLSSDLTDIEKYNIFKQAQEALYMNNDFKVSVDKKREFENILAAKLGFTVEDSKDALKSITLIAKQKPTRQFYHLADKNQKKIVPQWSAFENDTTIHMVLDAIGAVQEGGRGNFYRSLWNTDKTASLSVKRGQNLWKDFSSGKSGGIYQLVGYLDLSNPESPVVTENPNQTTHIQAYNWLIKKTNSTLPLAQAVDTVNNFSFTESEKQKITTIENYFEKFPENINKSIADAYNKNISHEKKDILKIIAPNVKPDEDNPNLFPSFLVKTRHPNCTYKVVDVAHCVIQKEPRELQICPDTPSFPYVGSISNPRDIDVVFKTDDFEAILNPQGAKTFNGYPTFILPKSPNSEQLKEFVSNNYTTINFKNPTNEFIIEYFHLLSESKKPIFINGQDLYSYVIDNKLFKYTEVVKLMAKNSPGNLFAREILTKIDRGDNYFTKVFEQAKKGKEYPPRR